VAAAHGDGMWAVWCCSEHGILFLATGNPSHDGKVRVLANNLCMCGSIRNLRRHLCIATRQAALCSAASLTCACEGTALELYRAAQAPDSSASCELQGLAGWKQADQLPRHLHLGWEDLDGRSCDRHQTGTKQAPNWLQAGAITGAPNQSSTDYRGPHWG
jgi:hypothetical protein